MAKHGLAMKLFLLRLKQYIVTLKPYCYEFNFKFICIFLFLSSISLVESSVLLYVIHILQYKHRNSTIRNVDENQFKPPFY